MMLFKNYSVKLLWIFIGFTFCRGFEDRIIEEIVDSRVLELIHDEISIKSELIDVQSQNVTVYYDGDSWIAELKCTFPYEDIWDISWHVQGQRLNDKSPDYNISITNTYLTDSSEIQTVLTFYNFTYNDVNQYTCLFAYPRGYRNNSLWAAPPPFVDGSNTTIVDEEDIVSLMCTSFPDAPLYWRLPGFLDLYNFFNVSDLTNSTEDISNSSVNVAFFANPYLTSRYYLCCMSMSQFGLPPRCTNVSVAVNSVPLEDSKTICFELAKTCLINYNFYAYPDLNPLVNCNFTEFLLIDSNATYHEPVNGLGAYIKYYAIINYTNEWTAYCTAQNSFGISDSKAVNFNGSSPYPYAPILRGEPRSSLNYSSQSVSAYFACQFSGTKYVNVTWLKIRLHQPSEGIEIVNNDSDYNIRTTLLRDVTTYSRLLIPNYNDHNNEAFVCLAFNDWGYDVSKPLFGRSAIRNLQISTTQSSYAPQQQVTITCSATGYPPPNLLWTVISEFDVVYNATKPTFDRSSLVTSTVLTFETDSQNPFVHVRCTGYDGYWLTRRRAVTKTVTVAIKPQLNMTSTCSTDSFIDKPSCTLVCDLQSVNASTHVETGWKYYIDNVDVKYINLENSTVTRVTPFRLQLALPLANYSAGTYRCWSTYNNSENVYADLTIAEGPGSPLNVHCSKNEDCIALYSTCEASSCQCISPHDIPLDDSPETLECLMPASPNQNCINNAQCEEGEHNYICRQIADSISQCTCNGTLSKVSDTGTVMCIQKAKYDHTCKYTEECLLTDPFSKCVKGRCDCCCDYDYSSNVAKCVYTPTGRLSSGAIIVIVAAVVLLMALIVALVGGHLKNRRQRPANQPSDLDMSYSRNHDEDDDLPYSNFVNDDEGSVTNVDLGGSFQGIEETSTA